jgi:putative nucleotidyltransferase with HDIG domain
MLVAEKLSEQVQTILSKKIEENSLVLPAPPTVVTRALQLVGDASFTASDATPLVERDSVIAAWVLRAANSVEQAGVGLVRTLPEALTKLGVDSLRSLLIEISAHRLFESKDARIGAHTRGLWEHSLAVAVLARELATLSKVAETEVAYVAGLLHDIGKPVVAFLLLEAEKNVASTRSSWIDSEAWVEVLQKVHRPIGVALAQKWGLPEPVATAIRDCNEYQTRERASVGNCVRLANAVAKRSGIYVGSVDRNEVESQVAIGSTLLGVDDAAVNELCNGLEDRVRALVM